MPPRTKGVTSSEIPVMGGLFVSVNGNLPLSGSYAPRIVTSQDPDWFILKRMDGAVRAQGRKCSL